MASQDFSGFYENLTHAHRASQVYLERQITDIEPATIWWFAVDAAKRFLKVSLHRFLWIHGHREPGTLFCVLLVKTCCRQVDCNCKPTLCRSDSVIVQIVKKCSDCESGYFYDVLPPPSVVSHDSHVPMITSDDMNNMLSHS